MLIKVTVKANYLLNDCTVWVCWLNVSFYRCNCSCNLTVKLPIAVKKFIQSVQVSWIRCDINRGNEKSAHIVILFFYILGSLFLKDNLCCIHPFAYLFVLHIDLLNVFTV